MLVKVLTLRFDPRLEGFDDTPIREFCRDKETLSVRDHFFVKDDVPYWAVMLTYNLAARDGEPAARAAQPGGGQAGKADYRSLLRPEDWPLFNALRDWRSGVAAREGVPPYIIVPNDGLAWIARERPTTLSALGQLRGMGAARAFAAALLRDRLRLELKPAGTFVAPVTQGVPFVGRRIFPGTVRLCHAARSRFIRTWRRLGDLAAGRIGEQGFLRPAESVVGHLRHLDTFHLRQAVMR